MGKFNCMICGKEFDRVGNGVYCPGPHYRPCPVCGKNVQYRTPSQPIRCCSKDCVKKLSEQSKSKNIGSRKCKECGKIFYPRQASQFYCDGPHHANCVVCGKQFEYTCRPSERRKTCSESCQIIERDNTHEKNTGYRNPASDPVTKKKLSEAHLSSETIAKTEATMLSKYNVTNIFRSEEFKRQQAELQRDLEFKAHRYDNYKLKTGFDNPMCDPSVKLKKKQTRQDHGPYFQPRSFFEKVNSDPTKCDKFILFRSDPRNYISSHYNHIPGIQELCDDLGVTDTPIYNILCENDCRDIIYHGYSARENELYNALLKAFPNNEIIRNDRTVISPYELDIVIKALKLGVEINPTYTHNVVGNHWGNGVGKYYHMYKSQLAEDNGFHCIHVFDWMNVDDVIDMILNLDDVEFSEFCEPKLWFSKGHKVFQVIDKEDQQRMIASGWLPVYDAGQQILYKHNPQI